MIMFTWGQTLYYLCPFKVEGLDLRIGVLSLKKTLLS